MPARSATWTPSSTRLMGRWTSAPRYDFLACSAYKFFGPHVGVLYGHGELLGTIEPYRVRPADYPPPQNWETGTVNLEGIAGTAAAARYLTDLGAERIAYERELTARLISGLEAIDGVTQYGTRDLDLRVPTVAFTVDGMTPAGVGSARRGADLRLGRQLLRCRADDPAGAGGSRRRRPSRRRPLHHLRGDRPLPGRGRPAQDVTSERLPPISNGGRKRPSVSGKP